MIGKPQPYLHMLPATSEYPPASLLGFHIPYLPDFLLDHTLLGQADNERATENLNRWTQFVLSLRKWKKSAFALRFTARPALGAIDCTWLVRAPVDWGPALAAESAAQLTAFGLPSGVLGQDGLREILDPFS